MKSTDIKFAAGQLLLTGGLAIEYIGVPWSFFTGLGLVMSSGLLSLNAARPKSLLGWVIRPLLFVGSMIFLVWFSSFGAEKPPLAALIGVWIGVSIDEFRSWQEMRGWRTG